MNPPKSYETNRKRFKAIPEEMKADIEGEIKSLLHAHRDTLRNWGEDTTRISFRANEGFCGESFGIMRTLRMLGYGYFGSVNLDGLKEHSGGTQKEHNLKWWFSELENEVLEEEGFFNKTYHCQHCLDKYGKDTRILLGKRSA